MRTSQTFLRSPCCWSGNPAATAPSARSLFMFRPGSDRRAFTLLEVMIAVAIITLITFSIYQFVRTNLTAIAVSQEISAQDQELSGFINFVQAQLEDLPMRQ